VGLGMPTFKTNPQILQVEQKVDLPELLQVPLGSSSDILSENHYFSLCSNITSEEP
jgi:hypothetical protein